ncbi:MAG: hypothetical protein ACRD1I_02260 [Terriglobia bacterium]
MMRLHFTGPDQKPQGQKANPSLQETHGQKALPRLPASAGGCSGGQRPPLQPQKATIFATKSGNKPDRSANPLGFVEFVSGLIRTSAISFIFIMVYRFVRILESGWFRFRLFGFNNLKKQKQSFFLRRFRLPIPGSECCVFRYYSIYNSLHRYTFRQTICLESHACLRFVAQSFAVKTLRFFGGPGTNAAEF